MAHPTETVYGLGAAPARLDPIIAGLKGRDPDRPLLRLGPGVGTLRRQHPSLTWSARAERLAGGLWPGPLTLVLPDGSPEGLAVRVEGHPVTRAVLREARTTMSSTSLNRSGERPARTSAEVADVLDRMPPVETEVVWLDVGDLEASPPSTIVSLVHDRPEVLRAGATPVDEVESCLGEQLDRERGGTG